MTNSQVISFVNFFRDTPIAYDYLDKMKFAKEAKKYLRSLAKAMNLPKGSYNVRYNEGGIAVSGEATLHGEDIYVQFSKFGNFHPVMFRKCVGQKDCCGKRNHFAEFADLFNIAFMAEKIRKETIGD